MPAIIDDPLGMRACRAAAEEAYLVAKTQADQLEMIGDFNPKMIHMVEGLGATVSKRYRTYRLMLDPTLEFKTARVID